MNAKKGLTKVDCVVAVACVVFVLANVPVIIAGGRGRAKLEVCLANLRTLTAAWKAYADDNDGKLVNGAPEQSTFPCPGCPENTRAAAPSFGGHGKELPWIGTAYAATMECGYKCAMDTGALWKYVQDYSIYRCPTAHKNKLITYIIVDAVNGVPGSAGGVDLGSRGANSSVWKNHLSQIRKSPSQLVFIDEGKITPDSYGVTYGAGGSFAPERWFDPPVIRHGDGTTISFADGHTEFKKWRSKYTVDFGRWAEIHSGAWGTRPWPSGVDPILGYAPDELAYQDLYWVQIHCWGKLGYTPTYPPDID
jgi:prepilin-type processing-associated H-X9-DG protein